MRSNPAAFFSPCPRGLEGSLAQELAALAAQEIAPLPGGVRFAGDLECCYRVNLWSRIASRVLRQAVTAEYRSEDDIYRLARSFDWTAAFDVAQTIRVDVTASRSPLKSIDFAALRIKDGVCDRFRESTGARPSVDTHAPDVRIAAFLDERRATLYLDTSGEPLFKRGYRRPRQEAPLKENLAAGLIALAGWNPSTEAFFDPMCGSGTLLCEAALIATGTAPGLGRRFGFERLRGHDPALWDGIVRAARNAVQPVSSTLFGGDISSAAVAETRRALSDLGVGATVRLEVADAADTAAPAAQGVWLANPPYGHRVGEADQLAALYPRLGTALKRRFAGWRCYFFTADRGLPGQLGLRESRRTPLFNGAIECRLFEFRMVSGRLKG
jgi:putative N6-adenine-specific DNA methylase